MGRAVGRRTIGCAVKAFAAHLASPNGKTDFFGTLNNQRGCCKICNSPFDFAPFEVYARILFYWSPGVAAAVRSKYARL